MNKKVIPIVVRLKQNNNEIVQGINQNDAGVIFDITVMDGLKVFDFSGYTIVTLKITKPDGTITVDSTGGSYVDIVDAENGRLKINIPTSCTAQNGMHYCRVGFASDDSTLFDAMMFNYFVGEDPNRESEDVIGTPEYPILQNLIAQVSGMQSAENMRVASEAERAEAEEQRQAEFESTMEQLQTALRQALKALSVANNMLNNVYEALAQGGSVDISQITELATKSYVSDALTRLDFGDTESPKTNTLVIYHGNDIGDISIEEGELYYDPQYNRLWAGAPRNTKNLVNEPCFIASATEPLPTKRDKLWIDTSGTPQIKYYDSSTNQWVSCNTAVYA